MLAHRRSSNDRPASAKAAAWSRRSAARFVDGAMAEMPSNKAASYTNSDQRQAPPGSTQSFARRVQYVSVWLTNASMLPSGDHEDTLVDFER
jgi:hypothetical protein